MTTTAKEFLSSCYAGMTLRGQENGEPLWLATDMQLKSKKWYEQALDSDPYMAKLFGNTLATK